MGMGQQEFPMTMHVNLSPEMEQYIRSKVGSGFYGNATEVIRDAVRRMQAADRHIDTFQTAVATGAAQLDRGEGVAYSPALMESMTQNALQEMHGDAAVDSDVVA
jgi:antitoxin ParD1/3/4